MDKSTGKRKILYPVFPGELKDGAYRKGRLSPDDLTGKGLRAYDVYRELGYEPLPVRDHAHKHGGSLHCLVNPLS